MSLTSTSASPSALHHSVNMPQSVAAPPGTHTTPLQLQPAAPSLHPHILQHHDLSVYTRLIDPVAFASAKKTSPDSSRSDSQPLRNFHPPAPTACQPTPSNTPSHWAPSHLFHLRRLPHQNRLRISSPQPSHRVRHDRTTPAPIQKHHERCGLLRIILRPHIHSVVVRRPRIKTLAANTCFVTVRFGTPSCVCESGPNE
jgi:hypothetical protein